MSEQQTPNSDSSGTSEESAKPTPKDVAAAVSQGKPGESPEQTIEGLRAALAKANAEAKENRLAAKELDELKKAQMSELEKAQTSAKEYEAAATQAQAEALRWRIAAKHGISDEDAATFLTGADEDTLTRQAERLASLSSQSSSPTTPKPDLTQGGTGEPPALNSSSLEEALKSKLGIS